MSAEAIANSARGEATIVVGGRPRLLRPTFTALVAAEDELGPLYALIERAGEGKLRVSEVATLFWHCLADRADISRELIGETVLAMGLAASAAPLRALLYQILQGRV